ncbi:MAG: hypothetical protein PXY39_12385 [archaeon]|jgi:hypothetical protein|nr:hypothetical protein [archaeon]
MTLLLDLFLAAISGFFAAVIMTLVEYPFWKRWGMQGVAEWQVNWVMISSLNKKWKAIRNPILSWTIASHLSHGVLAGIAFRLLLPYFFEIPFGRVSLILDAVVFGVALWFLFTFLGRRMYESTGKIKITSLGLLGALLSDTVYGFFLGLLIFL